jgi:hypothetical protein
MDLTAYRASQREQDRISDLFKLIPANGERALDVGARDGYLSERLVERYEQVVALDLETPNIEHPRIQAVKGNAAHLAFPDRHFDLVLCAEVLEHIPGQIVPQVCQEIARVARDRVVIGVPYREDLRVGRTTCSACGKSNPPWGHVNSFDEEKLVPLFKELRLVSSSFVGTTNEQTNGLSAALLDFAGNPFGAYMEEAPCIHCGQRIGSPRKRNLAQRIATRLAFTANDIQRKFNQPRGNWIHLLFARRNV